MRLSEFIEKTSKAGVDHFLESFHPNYFSDVRITKVDQIDQVLNNEADLWNMDLLSDLRESDLKIVRADLLDIRAHLKNIRADLLDELIAECLEIHILKMFLKSSIN